MSDEMRIIRVDLDVVPLPAFDTAAEAIAADEADPRSTRAAADSLLVGGAVLTDFAISDRVIGLRLSNAQALEVTATDKTVDWRVSRVAAGNDHAASHPYAPVRLLWPRGEHTVYDPTRYFACRRQHVVRELYAGQVYLNVYFVRGGALRFGAMWNGSEGMPMLCVSELEPMKNARAEE